LAEVSQYYELVVFTAADPEYASLVLDLLDEGGLIKHRLYRQHCSTFGDLLVKDISRIGRPLSKMVIVDNLCENFCL
jgi:CTD small phosphatase-like protein 2